MAKNKKQHERKSLKKDTYRNIIWISMILALFVRMILCNIVGTEGIAYFSFAGELYILFGCLFTYGLQLSVNSLVRYRAKREQYRNAERVWKRALLLGTIVGLIVMAMMLLFGMTFAQKVLWQPVAGMAILAIAPAVLFQLLTGICKGYLEGNGAYTPSAYSVALKLILYAVMSILLSVVFMQYGNKVSALLKQESYAHAYGAVGIGLAISLSSLIALIHIMIVLMLYRKRNGKQVSDRDLLKNKDQGQHIFRMLIGSAVPYAVYALLFRSFLFLDSILFIRQNLEEQSVITLYGDFYGKVLPLILILSLLSLLWHEGNIRKVTYQFDREEYRQGREKLAVLFQHVILFSVPMTIFTAVFSENLLNIFFSGDNSSMANLLSTGSIAICFTCLSGMCLPLLVRMRRFSFAIGCEAAAFAAQTMVFVLMKQAGNGWYALVVSFVVYTAVLAVFSFVLVYRLFGFRLEAIRHILLPVAVSGVSGLIAMLFNHLIASFAGTTIALLVGLIIGIVLNLVLLLMLHIVKSSELDELPFGGLLIALGRTIKLM